MTKIDPSMRYQNFQEVMTDISEGALVSQSFTEQEKDIYQKMASTLTFVISSFHAKHRLERDTCNILNGLEKILKVSSLEAHIQDNGLLIRCFIIGSGYRYYSAKTRSIGVNSIETFYSFFRSLPERKRQVMLDNLDVRLSQVKIEAPDYDDMPF